MKNKKRFLGLFLLYTRLCADIPDASLSDLSDNFQVIIDPLNKAILSAQLSVPVKKIHKKLGDSFNKGDVLLELDSAIYVAQLKKARAIVEKAQNTYQAKEELFDARIASLSELKEAYALWATAQADLEVSKKQLEACKIVAPYRGKIASVLLFEHELPQVGQPLVEVVGDEILLARMLVDAKYLPQLEIDKPIEVYVTELKRNLTARIKRIGSVIDPASSTIAVEAEIENTDYSLMAGMTGVTIFSNGMPSTQITIEEPKVKLLEVPFKANLIAQTILQNEGNFSETIKSGSIPAKAIPLEYIGSLNPEIAYENIQEKNKTPLNHNGAINPILGDYYYRKDKDTAVFIAFECQNDPKLANYYSYVEPPRVYEKLYHSGTVNPSLSEALTQAKEETKKPLPYQGHLNDNLNVSSLEKAHKEAELYRIVKEAELLNHFEAQLKDKTAPLSQIPSLKHRIKTAAIPIVSQFDARIADNYSYQKPMEAIAEKPRTLPAYKEKSRHPNGHIAAVDNVIKKLPKSIYHQEPLSYHGQLNDRISLYEDKEIAVEESIEEQVEPLAYIPEIKNEAPVVQLDSIHDQVEPLSFIPEFNNRVDVADGETLDEQIDGLTFIPELKTDTVVKKLPPVQYRADEPLAAIERAAKNQKTYPPASLIAPKEIAHEEVKKIPLEWRDELIGGGSGGKEIE